MTCEEDGYILPGKCPDMGYIKPKACEKADRAPVGLLVGLIVAVILLLGSAVGNAVLCYKVFG